jgi:two-component system, NarL family, sensor histidine kinase UhpB
VAVKQDGAAVRVSNVTDETWRAVLDAIFAFVGLFSADGVVLDSNEAPLVAGGFARDEVVGHRFVELPWFAHSEVERARISDAIARAAHGESSRLETTIASREGGLVNIDAAFAPLRDADGVVTQVVGTGVDVTVRRKAERELTRSRTRLAEAQRVAHVGSWEWNIAKDRVTWSEEMYRIYGVDPSAHVPSYQNFLTSVHEDDRAHTGAVLANAMENVSPFVYDHRILRPDGGLRMLHTRGEVVGDAAGRAARLVGSCWDITDRWEATRRGERARADAEAARDQLRALAARLSDVREDERREIARELHDQVGQALTALKLDLGSLAASLDGAAAEAARARLAAMDALVDATLDTTRRLSTSLRPAILDDLGLPAAIRWQARELAQRAGVACDARVPEGGPAVPPAAALALFRILQEALTNVTRHAAARAVRVELRVEGEQATLTVADDGRGFPADALARPTSLGLVGMRERALALGGDVTIEGAAGRGTTVTARVPLAAGGAR